MSAVTAPDAVTLPAECPVPVLAGPLGALVAGLPPDWFHAAWAAPCDHTLRIAASWSSVGADAQGALVQLDRLFMPAPPPLIEAWLLRVAFGVTNPPTDRDLTLRIEVIQDTCRELPTFLWTHDTRRRFAQRGPEAAFWPSDAEVYNFMSGGGVGWKHYRLRRTLRGIIAVGQGTTSNPGHEGLTQAAPDGLPVLLGGRSAMKIAKGVTAKLTERSGRYSAALPPAEERDGGPTISQLRAEAMMSQPVEPPSWVMANRARRGIQPMPVARPTKGNA